LVHFSSDLAATPGSSVGSISAWTLSDLIGSIGKSAGACWFADGIVQVKHEFAARKRVGRSALPDSERSATFVLYGLFYFGFVRPAVQSPGEFGTSQLSTIQFICASNAVLGAFVGFPFFYVAAELLRTGVSRVAFRDAMLRYRSTCIWDNVVGASFWIFADSALAHWPHTFLRYVAMGIWCMILSTRWHSVLKPVNVLDPFVSSGRLELQHTPRALDFFEDVHVQWCGGQEARNLPGDLMKAADKLRLAAAANTAS